MVVIDGVYVKPPLPLRLSAQRSLLFGRDVACGFYYYEDLKVAGAPFADETSQKYAPLASEDFTKSLYELRLKNKSSPMIQIADLYLWPMCIGGYDPANRPLVRLKNDRRLIDCVLSEQAIGLEGIKYSCWDLVVMRSQKQ
jgi:hypothetical protein